MEDVLSDAGFAPFFESFERDLASDAEARALTGLYTSTLARLGEPRGVRLQRLLCGTVFCVGEMRAPDAASFNDWMTAIGESRQVPHWVISGQAAGAEAGLYRLVMSIDPAIKAITVPAP